MKRFLSIAMLAGLVLSPAALAQNAPKAQPEKPAPPVTAKPAPQPEKPAMPDQKAMEEAWEKAGQPGANHKLLSQFEGEWQAEAKEFMPGGGTPESTKGGLRCKMMFGGRYLHMEFEGKMHEKAYHGAGLMGYNNTDKKFETTWADSMNTALSVMSGTADAAGKVITLTGQCTDPTTNQKIAQREVWTITDKDHFRMDFYMTMGGQEMKAMEISYTRGKGGGHDDHGKSDDHGGGKDKDKGGKDKK